MKKVIKELEKVEKIQICTSVQSYKEKPQKGISNINFMQGLYNTPFDVYTELRRGYCYSHYFGNGESRYFTIKDKTNDNFNSTQMIVIDIDNSDKSLKECIELLKNSGIKYNFILPSYSYTEEKPKFHIYFIFDFLISNGYYKHITNKLNHIVSNCIGVDVDSRNLIPSLYYNSCFYLNENISYLFENDLLFNSNDKITLEEVIKLFGSEENFYNVVFKNATNIRGTKTQRKKAKHNTQSTENQRKEQLKEELLLNAKYQILKNDISRLNFDEVQKLYGTEYKWIYKTTKSEWLEFNSKVYGKIYYQLKDMDNFINLKYSKKSIANGEMRRNKLHNRAVCRRMIYFDYMNETQQDIPFDVLFYNCYLDMHYIIDNSDKKDLINYNEIENICLDVMKYDIQELKEKFDTLFQNTKNNSSKAPFIIQGCKSGVKARKLMSEIKSMYIKKLYKSTLSYSENIKLLPFSISVRQYINLLDKVINKNKCSKVQYSYNDIIKLYNNFNSLRLTLKELENRGIKMSLGKLQGIIKKYKDAI